MNGYAEPLLIDALAHLAPAWRLTLFAIVGIVAGLVIDVVVRRVPVAIERAWQAELLAANAADAATHGASHGMGIGATAPAQTHMQAHAQDRASTYRSDRRRDEPVGYDSTLSLPTTASLPSIDVIPVQAPRRWLIGIVTMLLSVVVTWRFGPTWQSLGALGLAWTLIALAFIDFDTQLLPDVLTLPLLWAGLLCNLGHWFAALPSAVIGAVAGYLSLWLMFQLHRLWRGQEGMGFGDFKLFAALGAWFGWTALVQILTIACLLALVVAGGAWLAGRLRREQPFPFGPFLAIAGLVTLLGGNGLMIWIGGTP